MLAIRWLTIAFLMIFHHIGGEFGAHSQTYFMDVEQLH